MEWLIDRKKTPQTWKKHLKVVRDKIQEAISDLPKNKEIQNFVEENKMHYYDCEKMIELLKTIGNESSDKTLFGSYTSKRMQQWNEILKLYIKDDVHIAECAQLLTSYVLYEM